MNKDIESSIKYSIHKNNNIFESILDRFESNYNKSCNNILELKKRTTKNKGDMFENFCVYYLKNTGYQEAWIINNIPKEVLSLLKLKSFDVGIDIVAKKDNKYYAIQAKYRKVPANKKYNVLGWKSLSTFYAYCARTGPWEKHIVMTTCDYVRQMGNKSDKDYVINKKSFINTPKKVWLDMVGQEEDNGRVLKEEDKIDQEAELNKEQIRMRRADYFEKLLSKN